MHLQPTPYLGDEPFVFICYSHANSKEVWTDIHRLIDLGVNVWYDEGVTPGSEWTDALARRIQTCGHFLYFLSPESVASEHCRRELGFAFEEGRQVVAIEIKPVDMPPGLRLSLNNRQIVMKHKISHTDYEHKLAEMLGTPVPSRSSSSKPAPGLGPKRSWVAWSATVALLFVTMLGYYLLPALQGPPPPSVALQETPLTLRSVRNPALSGVLLGDGRSYVVLDRGGVWVHSLTDIEQRTKAELPPGYKPSWIDRFPEPQSVLIHGIDNQGEYELLVHDFGRNESRKFELPDPHRYETISPNGQWYLRNIPNGIEVASMSDTTSSYRLVTSAQTAWPVWSPENKWIAFFDITGEGDDDRKLKVVSMSGAETSVIASGSDMRHPGGPVGLEWINNEAIVYTRSNERGSSLWLQSLENGKAQSAPREVHTWQDGSAVYLHYSNGALIFTKYRRQSDVWTGEFSFTDFQPATQVSFDSTSEYPIGWVDAETLLYESQRDGVSHIYSISQGSDSAQLVTKNFVDGSSSGESLLAVTKEGDLVMLGSNSSKETLLTDVQVQGRPRCARLVPDRCLLMVARGGLIELNRYDPSTNTLGPVVFSWPEGVQRVIFDVAPDGGDVVVSLSSGVGITDSSRISIFPASGGAPGSFEVNGIVQHVIFGPESENLIATGMYLGGEPYAMVRISRQGDVATLWSGKDRWVHSAELSPNGQSLAVGITEFDSNLWLLEGLDGLIESNRD